MEHADKAKIEADELVGKAEEAAGHATGNDKLRREGRRQQAKASREKAIQNMKDMVRK